MPSFLKMMRMRSDFGSRSGSGITDVPSHPNERPRDFGRSMTSMLHSALTPTRLTSRQKQTDTFSGKDAKSNDDTNDPVIRCSMYPQMNGKRRSELDAEARTWSTKGDRGSHHHQNHATRSGRPARRQNLPFRARARSVDSEFSFDSGYSSDGNPEGRPVRVCMYPQAKYIKEPVKTSLNASSRKPSAGYSSSQTSKRSSLPGDEYQILVRRQKMQRVREMLEVHYTHHGSVRGNHIRHGQMQGFTVRNSERRRRSKMLYAVRKALQTDLDLHDDDFKLAINRHADRAYFCELSDVDGVPIDEQMLHEFVAVYQKTRNAAYAAMLPANPYTGPTQRKQRSQEAAPTLERKDSAAAVAMELPSKRPQLVSRFSWDSADGEVHSRKRLTKTK